MKPRRFAKTNMLLAAALSAGAAMAAPQATQAEPVTQAPTAATTQIPAGHFDPLGKAPSR